MNTWVRTQMIYAHFPTRGKIVILHYWESITCLLRQLWVVSITATNCDIEGLFVGLIKQVGKYDRLQYYFIN